MAMDVRVIRARIIGRINKYEAARVKAYEHDDIYTGAFINGKLSELRDILEMLEEL